MEGMQRCQMGFFGMILGGIRRNPADSGWFSGFNLSRWMRLTSAGGTHVGEGRS